MKHAGHTFLSKLLHDSLTGYFVQIHGACLLRLVAPLRWRSVEGTDQLAAQGGLLQTCGEMSVVLWGLSGCSGCDVNHLSRYHGVYLVHACQASWNSQVRHTNHTWG